MTDEIDDIKPREPSLAKDEAEMPEAEMTDEIDDIKPREPSLAKVEPEGPEAIMTDEIDDTKPKEPPLTKGEAGGPEAEVFPDLWAEPLAIAGLAARGVGQTTAKDEAEVPEAEMTDEIDDTKPKEPSLAKGEAGGPEAEVFPDLWAEPLAIAGLAARGVGQTLAKGEAEVPAAEMTNGSDDVKPKEPSLAKGEAGGPEAHMTDGIDDVKPKEPTLAKGEAEAPEAEVFPDPWAEALAVAGLAARGVSQTATVSKEPRESLMAEEPKAEPRKAKETKAKHPAKPRKAKGTKAESPAPSEAPAPEEAELDGKSPWDDNEGELLRQAEVFYWRGGSQAGRKRILRAARERRKTLRVSSAEYLVTLRKSPKEWDALWDLVDAGREDGFFRHQHQYEVMGELMLEKSTLASVREIRFLSVGCWYGFEPYSLSLFMRLHRLSFLDWRFLIDACDISEVTLKKAREANFTKTDLGWLTPEVANRWFTLRAAGWHFNTNLGPAVNFFKYNPADTEGAAKIDRLGFYDFIFCRARTFDCPEQKVKLLAREMASMLAPGGVLLTSPGELLPFVPGLDFEEREGVIYGRAPEAIRGGHGRNVFHKPKRPPHKVAEARENPEFERTLGLLTGSQETRFMGKDESGSVEANLLQVFDDNITTDPDTARAALWELMDREPNRILANVKNLYRMADLEAAQDRHERAAEIRKAIEAWVD
ncbi:MAG: hypothetical protein LBJ61_12055 [Deltaproteobacteria bacterium]|jgi:chemotaxis methyl-accepting protein methylase|nr:hypothetical protein [Deltaproteobacteria bacterium]